MIQKKYSVPALRQLSGKDTRVSPVVTPHVRDLYFARECPKFEANLGSFICLMLTRVLLVSFHRYSCLLLSFYSLGFMGCKERHVLEEYSTLMQEFTSALAKRGQYVILA